MSVSDFDFEFSTDLPLDNGIRAEVEERLRRLGQGHRDLTGANVAVTKEVDRNNASVYRARVVAYVRPENIAAAVVDESVDTALREALKNVERQVREQRDRLRERWKQP